ncbi:hypothetical protein ACWXVL_00735 [Mycoplasma sp. 128]|uniref:hypothetical protein n=1 Tax=Mycoplasma sp. 3341 TaxID=3447506 RepID=UPI003F6561D8
MENNQYLNESIKKIKGLAISSIILHFAIWITFIVFIIKIVINVSKIATTSESSSDSLSEVSKALSDLITSISAPIIVLSILGIINFVLSIILTVKVDELQNKLSRSDYYSQEQTNADPALARQNMEKKMAADGLSNIKILLIIGFFIPLVSLIAKFMTISKLKNLD